MRSLRAEQEFGVQWDIQRDLRCCVRIHLDRATDERILHLTQPERRRNLLYTRTTYLCPTVHRRINPLAVVRYCGLNVVHAEPRRTSLHIDITKVARDKTREKALCICDM